MTISKIHPLALGLSVGIIAGLSTMGAGLLAFLLLNGKPLVSMFGTMYVTYNPTLMNGVLAGLLVFINAIIVGFITAWIYNLLIARVFNKILSMK